MRWIEWLFGDTNGSESGDWDATRDSRRRELLSVANDGIVSSAAIIQGLLSGGATGQEAVIGVSALIAIGAVGSAASQYAEAAGERASILAIIDTESRRLKASPDEEFAELVELYENKGLSNDLAHQVATELTGKDALAAQLDAEFALQAEAPDAWFPFRYGAYSAGAFLIGSLVPLLFLLALPWSWRGEVTLVAVTMSLAISGWIGSYSDHSGAVRAIARTVGVGLIVLGISNLAGSFVTF